MGWMSLSERDLKRIEILSEVLVGRRTVAAAAAVLAISERQAYRLLARYEDGGGAELIHKTRGHSSNRSVNVDVRKYAVELVRTGMRTLGQCSPAEVLLAKHEDRTGDAAPMDG
jgi:transposase